ncbi:MAG: AAA family ATPase [Nitrosomonadales bacterium]|nr:AAA family ATPase [Nitrosomonadales bacterium]
MYYAHFGLREPPFKITPNTEFFFSGGNRGAVLDALTYAINSGEGIIKVVGEVGSGKTMLCRMLQTLLPEKVESVYLANPSVAPEDVLHAIAFELQLKLPKNADRLQVMQVLQTYLLDRHAEGKQVVIFVEEAQGMPLATLEEIRLLSNLETKHDKLLQIVLFGQPELDVNLNETQIRQLRERITHSFNLGPLAEMDVGEYLIFRLRAAGYFGPHLFSKSAIRMISKSSEGLVRRVNILADKALLSAFSDNVYQVTPKHVRAAIRDSEFGTEQLKKDNTQKLYLAAAAILVLGLALGYLINIWLADSHEAGSMAESAYAQYEAQASEPQAETTLDKPMAAPAQAMVGSSEDILEHRLNVTQQWLNQQPSSTVSIQLMGSTNDKQMRAQLESLASIVEIDNIYVYRTFVNKTPFISVLYGSYQNRQEAVEAMRKLPETLRSYRPQLRTIGGILQETKPVQ